MATKAIQRTMALFLGAMPTQAAASTLAVTAAAGSSVALAFSFVPPASPFSGTMRLQDLTIFLTLATGSPKLTLKLLADLNGAPDPATVIETGTESGVLSAGWVTLSGFTTTSNLTTGVQYWLCIFCTSGTSATVQWFGTSSTVPIPQTGSSLWNYAKVGSVDNGATWATSAMPNTCGYRVGLTDGTDDAYMGIAISAFAAATGATEKLYTDATPDPDCVQEFGSYFTSPANADLKVRGIGMYARKATTPAGSLRYRIYTGASPSLLGTTQLVPPGNVSSAVIVYARFAAAITIPAGSIVRVTAGNSAADTSSAYFYTYKYTIHDDAISKAIFPLGGIQSTKYTNNAWAEVTTEMVPFYLVLDSAAEFGATGSGGMIMSRVRSGY